MGDLQVNAESAGVSPQHVPPPTEVRETPTTLGARLSRIGRALRSGIFFVIYFCYLIVIMGLGQRVLLWPAIIILPRRRRALVRAWLRFHAIASLRMARVLAGVRLTTSGSLPAASCIVVMNHQSVLDIPLGLSLVRGPYALIPTRDRYRRGIPGISPLSRLARFPFLSQKRALSRPELASLTNAADQVARGEQSLLIFPEGHRTDDGRIGRFMRNGLRITLARASQPVYCVVADGMSHARTFADAFSRFAGTHIRVVVLGPFPPPSDDAQVDEFIDMLHQHMTAELNAIRLAANAPRPDDTPPSHAVPSAPAD
ncbi:MAG: lysophospholipid acyltransferase family protein [Gemmatimonadaceae bacterium]